MSITVTKVYLPWLLVMSKLSFKKPQFNIKRLKFIVIGVVVYKNSVIVAKTYLAPCNVVVILNRRHTRNKNDNNLLMCE
jgi:hypothetical protein